MTNEDPRLKSLGAEQRQVAAEFLEINNSWDTSFSVAASCGDNHPEGLRIRWETEKAFAEFRWFLMNGRPARELEVRSERGGWSDSRMPFRSLRNVKFARFLRRFSN